MRVGRINNGSIFRKKGFAGTGFFWVRKEQGDCVYAISTEASSHQVLNEFLNIYDIENRKMKSKSNAMVRFFCRPQDSYYIKRELSSRGFLFKFRLSTDESPLDIMIDTGLSSFKVAGGIVDSSQKAKVVAAVFEDSDSIDKVKRAFKGNKDFDFSFFLDTTKNLLEKVSASHPDVLLLSLSLIHI